jgi:hypothetical protein
MLKMLRLFLVSSLLVVATACGSRAPTGVVVAVTSEVPVPEEVNELIIQVKSEGSSKLDETYRIVPEAERGGDPRKASLPGTITLKPGDESVLSEPLLVTVQARLSNGENRFVRRATVRFVEEKQKLLRMSLRFACMDFPTVCREDETCKAGACVPAAEDLEQAPDFEETQVFSRPGACFDRVACGDAKYTIPAAAAFAQAGTEDCSLSLEELAAQVPQDRTPEEREAMAQDIRGGKFNFGFVWAANKAGKWTVVDQDPEEGWAFTDATRSRVRLSRGLCDVMKGKVTRADQSPLFTKVILNTACEPKPMAMPQCEAVDLIPAAPATPAPAAP